VVKLKVNPETIASGLNLCPAEPEKITGTSGRQHGLNIVTIPARKTINIEMFDGSIFYYLSLLLFYWDIKISFISKNSKKW
jgi:hypothetical protein